MLIDVYSIYSSSKYWQFTSKGTLYSFCPGKPPALIVKQEKWTLHKTVTLTSNALGVGPLSWHSVKDYPDVTGKLYLLFNV